MAGPEVDAPNRLPEGGQRFGTIIVVGGGCYGSYYVRQLQRAIGAGALACDRILVVDRDARCAVAVEKTDGPRGPWPVAVDLETTEWSRFFSTYLDEALTSREPASDAVVPSPLMPHLMADWLVSRIAATHPDRHVAVKPLDRAPSVPWSLAAPDGTHYVSFAEWTCPVNCVEPPLCPEIGTPRTWTLTRRVRDYASAEQERTGRRTLALLFHCRHRAYGVGMFDTGEVVCAESEAARAIEAGAVDLLIGTVSHCHGAIRRVVVA